MPRITDWLQWLLLGGGAALSLLGAGLLRHNWRRWRRVGGRQCLGCGYCLIGNASGRCPECGRAVPNRHTIRRERRRRAFTTAGGLGLLLLAGACLYEAADNGLRHIDWYHYYPTNWVVRDATGTDPQRARRAWPELCRRRTAGALPASAEKSLTEAALAEQARKPSTAGPLHEEWIEYLGARFLDGKLDAAQAQRFTAQAAWVDLEVRPVVRCGVAVPCLFELGDSLPANSQWDYRPLLIGTWLDETPIPNDWWRAPDWSFPGGGTGLLPDYPCALPPVSTPGSHTLRTRWRVLIYHGPSRPSPTDQPAAVREVVLEQPVLAVPAASDDDLKLLNRPDLAGELRDKIHLAVAHTASPSRGPLEPSELPGVEIEADPLPVPVAFDVLVRQGKEERSLGTFLSLQGRRMKQTFYDRGAGPGTVERADVILRPSRAAARRTVGMTEIWAGELTFPGVAIGYAPW